MKFWLSVFLGVLLFMKSQAQVVEVSGQIIDAHSEEELPFANVSITNSKLGVASNSIGKFRLEFTKENIQDTMIISFIGYETLKYPVKTLKQNQVYALIPLTETLDEFVLSPLTAKEFMKAVVQSIPENSPESSFSTLGYYSNRALENGNFLSHDEAIIKSYIENFTDTSALQRHQVVVHRKKEDVSEVNFMSREAEKEKKRAKKKGKDVEVDTSSINVVNMFGGLDEIIELMSLNGNETFLDTNMFKKYEFKYHDKPLYDEQGNEITLIHASTKGRVDKVKATSKIYIDRDSYGIIKMEGKLNIRIPLLIKPVLFMMGFGIENPNLHFSKSFQKLNGRWYPENLFVSIDLSLEKKRMFKANDNSKFTIQELYSIQQIETKSPSLIEKAKAYTGKKELEKQVFPEPNINWSSIRLIEF